MHSTLNKITAVSKTLVFGFLLMSMFTLGAAPASAATWNDLTQALQSFQATLEALSDETEGEVLGSQVIRVGTDQQLVDAIRVAEGGDTIELAPGRYGRIHIREDYPRTYVGNVGSVSEGRDQELRSRAVITSADKNNPAVVESIVLQHAPYWQFDNLYILPSTNKYMAVQFLSSDNAALTNSFISFGDNSSDWDIEDWKSKVNNGVQVRAAKNNVIADNYIENVAFGMDTVAGTDSVKIQRNVITDYTRDAFRAIGTNGLFEKNFVANAIKIDGHHDDMLQSFHYPWNGGQISENNTVRYNTMVHSTKDSPLRSDAQGIGMFDGPFKGWKIHNNLILANHWHGISVAQPVNAEVYENVVLDQSEKGSGPSWIALSNHKNGTPGTNTVVRDNYANTFKISSLQNSDVRNNTTVSRSEYDDYFVDLENYNFTLKDGAVPFAVGVKASELPTRPRNAFGSVPDQAPVEQEEQEEAPSVNSPVANFTISDRTPETGQSVRFNARSSENVTSYEWDDAVGSLGQYPLGEGAVIDFSFSLPGEKKVRLTASNDDGTDTKVVSITVRAASEEDEQEAPTEEESNEQEESPTQEETDDNEQEEESGSSDEDLASKVVTTNNLTVRQSPAGQRLGVQLRDATGSANLNDKVTQAGYTWVYVDFDQSVDGYVASEFLAPFGQAIESPDFTDPSDLSREELIALIQQLITLILSRQ